MPKRPYWPSSLESPNWEQSWSIGSGKLTAAGRAELLKRLGCQMQADYRDVLNEPPPDHLKNLLKQLKQCLA